MQALTNVSLTLGSGRARPAWPERRGQIDLDADSRDDHAADVRQILWNSGEVARNPDALRNVLGYLPQDFGVYPNLSALEFLEYLAAVKGIAAAAARRRITELLELVNLTDAAKRPLGGYSGGMRQRVGIAQALLNDPQLLIVDEPTAGLDPEERVRFRNLLSELSGERIVILSTHIVSDVEAVATNIAILAHGRLLAHGSPESILDGVTGQVWELVVPSGDLPALRQKYPISSTAHRSDGVHVRIVSPVPPMMPGARVARPLEPSLEDAYLAVLAERRSEALRRGRKRGGQRGRAAGAIA